MDKGLTVPKCVLINRRKIPQMPQDLSAQIVCPRPKVWDFNEKRLHQASVVRVNMHILANFLNHQSLQFIPQLQTLHFLEYTNEFKGVKDFI